MIPEVVLDIIFSSIVIGGFAALILGLLKLCMFHSEQSNQDQSTHH